MFYRLAPCTDDRSPVNASFCCDLLLFVVGVELMADHMGPARLLRELMGDKVAGGNYSSILTAKKSNDAFINYKILEISPLYMVGNSSFVLITNFNQNLAKSPTI